MEFAKRLIDFRRRKGMSQQDLAEAMGVARHTVELWESGEATPTLDQINQLAFILGCTSNALLYNPKNPTPVNYAQPRNVRYAQPHVRKEKKPSDNSKALALVFLIAGIIILLNLPGLIFGNVEVNIDSTLPEPVIQQTLNTIMIVKFVIAGVLGAASIACFIVSFVFYRKYNKQKNEEIGYKK